MQQTATTPQRRTRKATLVYSAKPSRKVEETQIQKPKVEQGSPGSTLTKKQLNMWQIFLNQFYFPSLKYQL